MTHPRAFVITVRDAPAERFERERQHLSERGIVAEPFSGINGAGSGLRTSHLYEVDHPGTGYVIGPATVGIYLSHYLLWRVLQQLPGDAFWVLEDDSDWRADWRDTYSKALPDLPEDWDLVFMGNCCMDRRWRQKVGCDLWRIRYAMCLHAYMVRKKALPVLSRELEKVYAPLDAAIAFHALPKLNTYAFHPRLCGQFNTDLPP